MREVTKSNMDDIFLTHQELEILYSMQDGSIKILSDIPVDRMIDLNLISKYLLSECENEFVITPFGMRYLCFLSSKSMKQNADYKREIRIAIIGSISGGIAGLIVSIFTAILTKILQ